MEKPLVSVIVAIYNIEDYLEKCLISLANQDIKEKYEVFLVNDSSSDSSPQIIDKFVDKYPNIFKRLDTLQRDCGMVRNFALDYAKGKYICFIDGDDYLSKDYLSTFVNEMKRSGAQLVVANYFTDKDGHIKKTFNSNFIRNQVITSTKAINRLKRDITIHGYVWTKIYLKEIIDKYHLRFPHRRTFIMEDWVFTYSYLCCCSKVSILSKRIYYYVQRASSIVNSVKGTTNSQKTLNSLAVCKYISMKNNRKFSPSIIQSLFIYCFQFQKTHPTIRSFKSTHTQLKNIKKGIFSSPNYDSLSVYGFEKKAEDLPQVLDLKDL